MDRDRIERRDFPTGRRGYDPAAVDEHLRRVADEFEAHAHAPTPSLASSTSEQVRLILQAAEDGAAEMRASAGSEASDHVERVQTAADGMLSKLDALESELANLLSALRTSGERLVQGLAELQTDAAQARTPGTPPHPAGEDAADVPSPAATPPVSAPAAPEHSQSEIPQDVSSEDAASPAGIPEGAGSQDLAPESANPPNPGLQGADPQSDAPAHESPPLSAPDAPDWPAPADALFADAPADDAPFAAPSDDGLAAAPAEEPEDDDDASARLIALNMALNGSSRDDTRVFLEEHFSLPDVEALLDDVYARAGR